jgi:2-succinyl-5-enolpyruvyl-6-hydroxy-3-cyclohexene-1-carboxylate synthase
MFGADYAAVKTQADFRRAMQAAFTTETSQVIEVFSDSVLHEQTRREINQRYSHYQREKEQLSDDRMGRS